MASKAMWRNGRPVVLAVCTNDGLSGSAKNIATLLDKKNVYFVPYRQDDPVKKPTSLVADFTQINAAVDAALEGRQLQPLLLGPAEEPGYSFVKGNGKDRTHSPFRKRGRIRRRVCATPPCGGQFPETWR